MKQSDVLFTILNYKEATNSERLYRLISPYFACRILDADSGQRPDAFNGDTLFLPNIYFGGLLNRAIQLAQEGNYPYVFFICSDVQIEACEFERMKDIFLSEDFRDVAVYSPSHSELSYTFVRWGYNAKSNQMRKVPCVEAMISMWSMDIYNAVYPCASNKFGWGVDICAAYYARTKHKKIIIDDRVRILHPQGGKGKNEAAWQYAKSYIDQHLLSKEIYDLWHWIYVYRLNKSANILLLKNYKFWCRLFYKLRKFFPCFGYKF